MLVSRRETWWYPLAYAAGFVLLSGGASKMRPPKRPGASARVRSEGPGDHDVISYVLNTDGTVFVQTQAKDVEWGTPKLQDKVMGQFRSMLDRWGAVIDEAGVDYRLPSSQIAGEMWAESNGVPNLTSEAGAVGLMQILPIHFSDAQKPMMFDPRTNIRKGAELLQKAKAGFRDIVQVASAYNAGGPRGMFEGPWTNETWLAAGRNPSLTSRWGYACQAGYIDRVVAASNTYIALRGGLA